MVDGVRTTAYFAFPFLLGAATEELTHLTWAQNRFQLGLSTLVVFGLLRIGTDLAVIAASATIIVIVRQASLLRQFLRTSMLEWLGKVSFSLYLVHVPLMAALHHLLHTTLPPTALFLLSIFSALPTAWLFYVLIERSSHQLARKITLAGPALLRTTV